MRIEQYFLMIDYSLWEVILNGDSPPLIRSVEGVETPYPPTIVEEKLARKNELKARAQIKGYGPNVVKTVYSYRTVEITDKNIISFKVNKQRLKKYYDGHKDMDDNEVVEFEEDTT
uniref:Uncharacterized protein n=1 Tax=Tanacetum cinerariifolium TaxID=118510 RepID=A0A699L0I3_TANCI|nr:hypothetical protein [Tanacetum cinerariifolium]